MENNSLNIIGRDQEVDSSLNNHSEGKITNYFNDGKTELIERDIKAHTWAELSIIKSIEIELN